MKIKYDKSWSLYNFAFLSLSIFIDEMLSKKSVALMTQKNICHTIKFDHFTCINRLYVYIRVNQKIDVMQSILTPYTLYST